MYSCYWKLLRKYCQIVTYALFHCSTVYTVILFTLLLLHHWYCYCHSIVPIIKITRILIVLNNNVNWQLTMGLRKLMQETTSVFWVDLGYRLHSRHTVPLQGYGGWLTSRIVHIVIVIDYLAVGAGSVPGDWVVILSMYGNLPKAWTVSLLLISIT